MSALRDLRRLFRSAAPLVGNAIASGRIFKPQCELTEPDPDVLCEYDVRIPLEDITTDERRERVAALSGRGMRFTVRSAGVPDAATRGAIAAAEAWLERLCHDLGGKYRLVASANFLIVGNHDDAFLKSIERFAEATLGLVQQKLGRIASAMRAPDQSYAYRSEVAPGLGLHPSSASNSSSP